MKLVMDLVGFQRGKSYGFEEYISNLLIFFSEHINDIKVDQMVIVCHPSQQQYFESLTKGRIIVLTVNFTGLIERLLVSRHLPKMLELTHDDIILYSGNTMPLKNNYCKKILVIHDLLFLHGEICAKTFSFLLFRLHKYIYIPRSIKLADKIISISEFTKEEIIEHYKIEPRKIEPIYNYFNFCKYDDNSPRTIKDIAEPYVLSVCSDALHKNHSILLKGFEFFAKNNNYHLVLVGAINPIAQSVYDSLLDSVKSRIVIVKHISNSDFKYLYSNASVYVSTSLYEGLGMPVVEAMYFGLPTVLSDVVIHREISLGKGLYFKASDYFDCASAIKKALEMKTNIECKSRIENLYSPSNTSNKYISLINTL